MEKTLSLRDVKAIENGMKKYNVDEKGFLEIVEKWVKENKKDEGTQKYNQLLYFRQCVKIYYEWHKGGSE